MLSCAAPAAFRKEANVSPWFPFLVAQVTAVQSSEAVKCSAVDLFPAQKSAVS